MFRNKIAHSIISQIDNNFAHESYYQINSKIEQAHLASNPNLSDGLWFKLANKSNIDTAIALYSRELTLSQLELALKDKRVYAKNSLIKYGFANAPENFIDEVLDSNWINPDLIKSWLHYGTGLNGRQIRLLADKIGGNLMIRQLGNKEAYPDIIEVVDKLLANKAGCNSWDLNPVFRKREELINHLTKFSSYNHRSAFAASWHLSDLDDQLYIFGKNTLKSNISVWTSFLCNPYTKLEIVEKIRPHAVKEGIRSDLFRALSRMDSAPGTPLSTPLDEIEDGLDRERAEYFSTYNSAYHGLLPWQEPYNYINKSEDIDISDLIVESSKAHMLYFINWEKVCTDLNLEMSNSIKSWSNFWSLIENWNGSLLELARASNSLA
jgi:hypothetical protein